LSNLLRRIDLMRLSILTLAAVAALATPAFAQSGGLTPPNEQVNCTEWTRKLETGLEVIAPTPRRNVSAAQAALQRAKAAQQGSQWYACSVAADSGLRALDAG
jgi:hypothetical protein